LGNIYRSLDRKGRVLVWAAGVVLVVLVLSLVVGNAGVVAAAQIAAALGTLVLAALAYAQVREMREARMAQQRPHVIVDADYSHQDWVSVVVKNIGPGAAKDVTFEFSAPLPSTLRDPEDDASNFVVSELPFLEDGLDYLAPGVEIRSDWDTYTNLFNLLEEKGLKDGIGVTSHYRDLFGTEYTTEWKINPFKVEGAFQFSGPRKKGVHELVNEVKGLHRTLGRAVDQGLGELQVSTAAERLRRREDVAAGGAYGEEDKVRVKRDRGLVLNGQVFRYLGDGLYRVAVSGQGMQTIAEEDLLPRPSDDRPDDGS
jgi:hypothetical protein